MDLADAIENDDLPEVRRLLDAGADINEEHDGSTPLLTAIRAHNLEAVKELIRRGANVNAGYHAPFVYAMRVDDPEIMRELARAGAEIPATDKVTHQPLLEYAVENRALGAIPVLLERGLKPVHRKGDWPMLNALFADPDPQDDEPLKVAVRALVQAGAPMTAKDPMGGTLIDRILLHKKYFVLPVLAEAGYPITRDIWNKIDDPAIQRQLAKFTARTERLPLLALRKERKEARYAEAERRQTAGKRRRRRTLRKRKQV